MICEYFILGVRNGCAVDIAELKLYKLRYRRVHWWFYLNKFPAGVFVFTNNSVVNVAQVHYDRFVIIID